MFGVRGTRAVYLCAAHSPHIVDVELLERGLHDQPADLRAQLQARIDAASAEAYDAILLAYGLCGQATAGIRAPLGGCRVVVPRARLHHPLSWQSRALPR